ncbi:DUF5655 domain-containing protein [Patescibacteria group bacterium]
MWTCSKCGRIFKKTKQPHSCRKIPLEQHFKNKEKAKDLFDFLVKQITSQIGECQIISLPCCVHLFGKNDFLAALPKKDRLEVRFALDRIIKSPRLKQVVPLSKKTFKNCFDIYSLEEFDDEFIEWLRQSYHLMD